MAQFIDNIFRFIFSIVDGIYMSIVSLLNSSLPVSRYQITTQFYTDFLNKDVFIENSWIGINITWKEMIFFIGTLFISILFIVLFVKFILKIVSVFRV